MHDKELLRIFQWTSDNRYHRFLHVFWLIMTSTFHWYNSRTDQSIVLKEKKRRGVTTSIDIIDEVAYILCWNHRWLSFHTRWRWWIVLSLRTHMRHRSILKGNRNFIVGCWGTRFSTIVFHWSTRSRWRKKRSLIMCLRRIGWFGDLRSFE